MSKIDNVSISGFKSILRLDELKLNDLNVLIGANGVGKSNFVSYFRMLHELVERRLQIWTSKQGGADRILSYGVKETEVLQTKIIFGDNGYLTELTATADSGFTFNREQLYDTGHNLAPLEARLGSGHNESNLKPKSEKDKRQKTKDKKIP